MSYPFASMAGAVKIAATGSNVQGTITFPVTANALHIANTSATLYVTAKWGVGAQTATLGGDGISIPPMSYVIVEAGPATSHLAAIGSGAGPTDVIFTPGIVRI
jgi:hypothetical protein